MNHKHKKLKIGAVGDIHAYQNSRGVFIPLFEEISSRADVLLLCGDLTNVGQPEEALALAEDLQACRIPALAVLGNHDHQSGKTEELKKILTQAKLVFLEDRNFEFRGVGFAGAKGFGGGFGDHMLASFGEQAIKDFVAEAVNESLKLENHLRTLDTKQTVVVLHYAPIIETIKGEPLEIYPFLGSSRLAETIGRFKVNAVFHGHAHRGQLEGRTPKNTPVYNCCFDLLKRKHGQHPYVLAEV